MQDSFHQQYDNDLITRCSFCFVRSQRWFFRFLSKCTKKRPWKVAGTPENIIWLPRRADDKRMKSTKINPNHGRNLGEHHSHKTIHHQIFSRPSDSEKNRSQLWSQADVFQPKKCFDKQNPPRWTTTTTATTRRRVDIWGKDERRTYLCTIDYSRCEPCVGSSCNLAAWIPCGFSYPSFPGMGLCVSDGPHWGKTSTETMQYITVGTCQSCRVKLDAQVTHAQNHP